MLEKPRIGSIGDALRCSEILNNWIEKTIWMPRLYSKQELLEMIEGAIPMREIWVVGDPVLGYISFNKELSQVVALYSDMPVIFSSVINFKKLKSRQPALQCNISHPVIRIFTILKKLNC